MRVLVTGAAGRLGPETVSQLLAAGHEVVATDVAVRRPIPFPVHQVSLLDLSAVAGLVSGTEAVVHLGNYSGVGKGTRTAAHTFNDNVAMNMNVFQSAIDAGVKRILFASTVQVVASESGGGTPFPPYANHVAYLPMDSRSPKNPGNAYALSKSVGETMLEQYVAPHGLTCVALRLPQLSTPERFEWYRRAVLEHDWHASRITQAFSVLSFADAAAAFVACLTADLRGFNVFFPAQSQVRGPIVPTVIARHFATVPLKRPIDQIESLVDHSDLTRATGWRPRNLI